MTSVYVNLNFKLSDFRITIPQKKTFLINRTEQLFECSKKKIIMSKIQIMFKISGTCITGATTASTSPTLVGYATDGYPVYGYAKSSSGTTLKSCWSSSLSSPTNISDFTYSSSGYSAGTCHLVLIPSNTLFIVHIF